MKKKVFVILLPLLFSVFGVSKPKTKIVEIKADTPDRLVYLDKSDGPGWWQTHDDTFIHYWSEGTNDVSYELTKINDLLFTATIPESVFDSGGGFRFYVIDRTKPQHQTIWHSASNFVVNRHNYFKINSTHDLQEQTTISSLFGDTYQVTKYRGATVIGTDEALKNASYTPSFVYQQGYKLEGWYTNSDLSTPYVVGELSGNISLYGKYTAASDYYVYFRKPDDLDWGTSIKAYYYYEGSGILLGGEASGWPGDSMTEMMSGGHGYVIKVDAGYNARMIIFNDGTYQTDNTPLIEGKVYTYSLPDGYEKVEATPNDFQYRLFKKWGPWNDEAKALAELDYEIGNGATVALKAGDKVKMNISSHIWAPYAKLTGIDSVNRFEVDDGDYKAKVSGVYKFTYNESYALGTPTATKTAQITADDSTVSFELVTVENDKIAAVDQRLAEINTCEMYDDYDDYVTFVTTVLGPNGMNLISDQNQAKLALMQSYIASPPTSGSNISNTNNNVALVLMIVISTALISLYFFLDKKRFDKQAV